MQAMPATTPSMSAPSGFVLEPLREGQDITLYRGRQHGNPAPILAVVLSTEPPSPQALQRLEHEYSLAAELDPAWAAKPLALARQEGRTTLVLNDPGGGPLDLILDRQQGQSLEVTRFFHVASGFAGCLARSQPPLRIPTDIKPSKWPVYLH